MLVLPLSHIQHGDATATITFAKSILVAIPITFLFFVPLLLAERLGLSFWFAYVAGDSTLEQMARFQGQGSHRFAEQRVLATDFVKGRDGWRIAKARFA